MRQWVEQLGKLIKNKGEVYERDVIKVEHKVFYVVQYYENGELKNTLRVSDNEFSLSNTSKIFISKEEYMFLNKCIDVVVEKYSDICEENLKNWINETMG